ncbi:MAG TPA: hypothetical protein VMV59_00925 [Candidatus Dormibacteraeota bacterium]|nr:hypothetical protein [Candidatus Dormibacteraeota bacterium]
MAEGTVCLSGLYDFVFKHRGDDAALQINGTTQLGREYCKICKRLTAPVPSAQGFYLWGQYNDKRFWTNIYLGKAGLGKSANLRSRLCEELKDERAFAWRAVYTSDELSKIRERMHGPKYVANWERAAKKVLTTHIIWVSMNDKSNADVLRIEEDLIEALNPIANLRRTTPPPDLKKDATVVFDEFREQIHHGRSCPTCGNRLAKLALACSAAKLQPSPA